MHNARRDRTALVPYTKVSWTAKFFRWMGRLLGGLVNWTVAIPENSKHLVNEAKKDYSQKRSKK